MHAFSCPATLHLTLLAKGDEQIDLYRQGSLYRRLNVKIGNEPLKVLHLVVPSKPGARGPCNFRIASTGLVGSTVVAVVPSA